jgi:hypothetical protein
MGSRASRKQIVPRRASTGSSRSKMVLLATQRSQRLEPSTNSSKSMSRSCQMCSRILSTPSIRHLSQTYRRATPSDSQMALKKTSYSHSKSMSSWAPNLLKQLKATSSPEFSNPAATTLQIAPECTIIQTKPQSETTPEIQIQQLIQLPCSRENPRQQ